MGYLETRKDIQSGKFLWNTGKYLEIAFPLHEYMKQPWLTFKSTVPFDVCLGSESSKQIIPVFWMLSSPS